MTKTAATETMTAGACPRCHQPWRCIRRGEMLFLTCNTNRCALRRLQLHGYGHGGAWAAVVAEESTYTVLCVGGESQCWDALLRGRRSGQLAVVAPIAAT
jgi:hypothetical protein